MAAQDGGMMKVYLDLRRPLGLNVVPNRITLSPSTPSVIIGRGSKANVFLYAGEHPSFVSREHAQLEYINGTWFVSDMESVNGMFFNSVKLIRGEKKSLSVGDRIYFGNPQHSFFVEYEFIAPPRKSVSPALSSGSLLDSSFLSDKSLDELASQVSFSSASTSLWILSEADVPEDVWAIRILPYLDMKELFLTGLVSKAMARRAEISLNNLQVVRWRHPWMVETLVNLLARKADVPTARPVRKIVTEGCYKVRDDHVERIAQLSGDHLQYIDLSGTPTVTARGMLSIARHCPNVKTLIVRGCKRVGARVGGATWEWLSIMATRGALEHCDLHCAGSTDEAVVSLARYSPHLKRIDLGVMATEGVTDLGLLELAEYCRELEHVDLRGCKHVSNHGVSVLATSCGSRLKTLVLHSCDVGDDSLRAIGESCSSLEILDIHRCLSVRDEGVRLLVTGPANVAESLRYFDLSNLIVTDGALEYLKAAKVRLEVLDLRSCKLVTGQGLISLISVMYDSLKKLDINGCVRVYPSDVYRIAKFCVGHLKELEIGARDDECDKWTPVEVSMVKQIFGNSTMVHDAFDFPRDFDLHGGGSDGQVADGTDAEASI